MTLDELYRCALATLVSGRDDIAILRAVFGAVFGAPDDLPNPGDGQNAPAPARPDHAGSLLAGRSVDLLVLDLPGGRLAPTGTPAPIADPRPPLPPRAPRALRPGGSFADRLRHQSRRCATVLRRRHPWGTDGRLI